MTAVILGAGGVFAPAESPLDDTPAIVGMTITSAGGSIDLLSDTYQASVETTGLTGAESGEEMDLLPGVDGAFVIGANSDRAGLYFEPAYPLLSVRVNAATPSGITAAIGEVRRVLNVRRYGPAVWRVTRSDGEVRELAIRHRPAAGDFDRDLTLSTALVLLRFSAPSPFWLGTPGQAGPWSVGGALPDFYPFGPDWEVASSTVLGEANPVAVGGDEITWPTVTVTGPATSVEVSRADGRSWTLTPAAPLTVGQTLIVRHDPQAILGGLQVEGPSSANWSQYLEDGSDLFELRPGSEAITVLVAGSDTGTSARVDWPTRYESAV